MINSGGIIGEEMTDYLFITGTGAGAANTAGNSKVVEATATNNGGAAANIQKNKVAPQSEDEDEEMEEEEDEEMDEEEEGNVSVL